MATSQTNIMNNQTENPGMNQFGYQQSEKFEETAKASESFRNRKGKKPGGSSLTWSQFTQNTTFHGLKYIFEDAPNKTRRIAWTICVCAAIGVFVGQVSFRVAEYLKYKTNVSMKVTYSESIQFPALTVCNQNKFRIMVAYEKKAYRYLNQYYSMDSDEDGSQYKDDVHNLDTKQLFVDSAHKFEDLIDMCRWKGDSCSPEDFTETLTDEGICYTYNLNGSKRVTESGARHALQLIINVEQYQHMRGPQKDAGVKILLHNPSDPPEMKDLGFVAAPGFHTLVAIKYLKESNLPHPHGDCLVNTDSMPLCKRKCEVAQFVSTCGCKDIYMDSYVSDQNVNVCALPKLFACREAEVTNATYRAQLKEKTCPCPTKCQRSTYHAKFSSALLSRFNVDTMALLNTTKRSRAEKYLLTGREVSARLVPEYEAFVKPLLLYINSSSKTIHDEVTKALNQLKSEWATFLTNASSMLNHMEMREISKDRMNLFRGNPELDKFERVITYMIQLLGMSKQEAEWLRRLTALCGSAQSSFNEYLKTRKCSESHSKRSEHGQDCTENIRLDDSMACPIMGGPDAEKDWNCLCYLAENSRRANMTNLVAFNVFYNDTIHNLYKNDVEKLEKIHEHQACLELLQNATEALINPYSRMEPLLADFVNSPNASFMANIGDALQTAAEGASLMTYKDIGSTCWWFSTYSTEQLGHKPGGPPDEEDKSVGEVHHEQERLFQSAMSKAAEGSIGFQLLQDSTIGLIKQLGNLQKSMEIEVKPVMTIVQNYIDERDRRFDLAGNFSSQAFKIALHHVDERSTRIKGYLETIRFNIRKGLEATKDTFTELNKLMIPFMDDNQLLNHITFGKVIKSLNITAINNVLNMAGVSAVKKVTGVEGTFNGLADQLITIYVERMKNLSEISKQCAHFVGKGDSLKKILDKFMESLEMTEDFYIENFLQVDVFYEELKYETIEEQEAFPILSLFGEIGGFMGLLLGASLITACEVIDFMCLKLVGSSRK